MSVFSTGHVAAIVGAIRSSTRTGSGSPVPSPVTPSPFVTISRQAGTGGRALGHALARHLSQRDHCDWTCYDRELVEKVAVDHRIERTLVESLEDASHSWVKDFIVSTAVTGPGHGFTTAGSEEFKVFRRVAMTIRAIAQTGHAIVVGRGGVFVTRNLPDAHGVHLRLIAPFEHRVAEYARHYDATPDAAAAAVRRLDANRAAFFKRYWPAGRLDPLTFTATFNTAQIDEQALVHAAAALIAPR